MVLTSKIDGAGRVLLPLKIRRELGLAENTEVILRVEDGELRLHTRKEAMRRAKVRLAGRKKPGESVVTEFLAERRQEAQRER